MIRDGARHPRGRWLSLSLVVVFLLAACGGDRSPAASSSPSADAPSDVPASSPTGSSEPFVSAHYGYVVTSPEWTGTDASQAWDGTGSPGDTDPTVDAIEDPEGHVAFGFGEPTHATLQRFAAEQRRTNATVHPCPVEPDSTESITVGGEPAILDEMYCPRSGGPFVMTAFVIHAGHADVFFTYTNQVGNERSTRAWFRSFLQEISFMR